MIEKGGVSYNESLSPIGQEAFYQTDGYLLYAYNDFSFGSEPNKNVAYYFDVISSHELNITDNITDNWLENSTVVNDSISQNPIILTLSGLSAELVYKPSMNGRLLRSVYDKLNNEDGFLSKYTTTDKLAIIPELYPPIDNITQTAKNVITTIEDNLDRSSKIFDNFTSSKDKETRLQEIYNSLNSLRAMCKLNGEGLTIETPYTTLKNMFIQTISLKQDQQDHITDLAVSLKQVNFSNVETTKADPNVLADINNAMRQAEEDKGNAQGVFNNNSENTILADIFKVPAGKGVK